MDHQSHREPAPAFGVLSRLYWMAFGPIAIIMISIAVIMKSFENDIPISLIYWGLVFSVILIRYLDIRFLEGETADGEPATLNHWKKFSIMSLIIFTAIWLVLIFFF